ncbi:Glucan 1,3-beta-glucosidase, partial [Globisporangium splendens]
MGHSSTSRPLVTSEAHNALKSQNSQAMSMHEMCALPLSDSRDSLCECSLARGPEARTPESLRHPVHEGFGESRLLPSFPNSRRSQQVKSPRKHSKMPRQLSLFSALAVFVAVVLTGSVAAISNETAQIQATHIQSQIRSGAVRSRGVNLGGWLVAEYWMSKNAAFWQGLSTEIANGGEYTAITKSANPDATRAKLETHHATFITEADIAAIAAAGFNTVRVPIGYWIVGFDINDPSGKAEWNVYTKGTLKYLDSLIWTWAKNYNVAVLIDIHAAKGSQNGNDHSSPPTPGASYWSGYQENVQNTITLATFLANRYRYDDAFLGIGLLNEPSASTTEDVLYKYYEDAYKAIRGTGNDCVLSVAPLLYKQNADTMVGFMQAPAYTNVWVEWHPYFVWGYEQTPADDVINIAVKTNFQNDVTKWLSRANHNRLLFGEWSFATGDAFGTDQNKFYEYAAAEFNVIKQADGGFTFWSWRVDGDENIIHPWSLRSVLRDPKLKQILSSKQRHAQTQCPDDGAASEQPPSATTSASGFNTTATCDNRVALLHSGGTSICFSLGSRSTLRKDQHNYHATVSGLTANTKYFYKVGSAASASFQSDAASFTTARAAGSKDTFELAVYGDFGVDANAEASNKYVNALAGKIDFIYHVGDISYADNSFLSVKEVTGFHYEETYNRWMNSLTPVMQQVPYMVLVGNHEAECHSPTCIVSGSKKDQLGNYTAYNTRFKMPSAESGGVMNMWYSFDYASVHFTTISSETDYQDAPKNAYTGRKNGNFGNQMAWLEADLKKANENRGTTPWLIVGMHRALYTLRQSDDNGVPVDEALPVQKAFEELFIKYKVDLVVCGHVHAYERHYPIAHSKPVLDGVSTDKKTYKNPKAPVYIISGATGSSEAHASYKDTVSPWNVKWDNTNYGIGQLKVTPSTLSWKFIASESSKVLDCMELQPEPLIGASHWLLSSLLIHLDRIRL